MSASLQDETGFQLTPVVWLDSRQSRREALGNHLTEKAELNFKVTTQRRSETTVLVLEGELDMATVSDLDFALGAVERGPADGVVVDLSELQFLDCSGLHRLMTARDRVVSAGGTLKLVPGPKHVRRLFTLTRVEHLFEFVEDPVGTP
ncbi:MAG TPA: STAS domain-containing protein [Actinomycetota bacterium]|nr:STAS domain-containing protein [Actinomycetota bacterium]